MKILLTHGYFLEEDMVERQVMKPYPPLGMLYISGYLNKMGIEHHVFDSTFRTMAGLRKEIQAVEPEIIGFYVNFMTRSNVLRLIDWIRNNDALKDTRVVLGGPDVRHHTRQYLLNGADFLVLGEGERTFYELVYALKEKRSISEVKGVCFLTDEKEIHCSEERPLEPDLSSFPLPNRDAIELQDYLSTWKENHGYSSITVSTQRGCPFTCKWCSHAVYGDTYRRRMVDDVVDELALLKEKYDPDSFWFVDDVFTMSEKWISDFTKALSARRLMIKYECITRADRLNSQVLSNLKSSGCTMLWIGAESGSQKVLDLMDRRVKAEEVREMIRSAKSLGIKTGTFIMLGYPGEDQTDINETIRHLKEAGPDLFTINMAYPIKGTKLYNEVEQEIEPGWDWKSTPDRDLRFKRKYGGRYYDFAVRKVYNEVQASREKNNGNPSRYLKHKLKALISGALMQFIK